MKASRRVVSRRLAALLLLPPLAACGAREVEAPSPEAAAEAAAATITATDMGREVGALAADSMRGRDTPSPELEKAATYLADRFEALGLEPAGDDGSYIQRYDYTVTKLDPDETTVEVVGTDYAPRYGTDFFMVPGMTPSTEAKAYYLGEVGSGVAMPDGARGSIVIYDHPVPEVNAEWQQKLMATLPAAAGAGVSGLIVVLAPDFPAAMVETLAGVTAAQRAPFPIVGITNAAAQRLFAAAGEDLDAMRAEEAPESLGDAELEIRSTSSAKTYRVPNVVAVLPGSDPTLKDTYVVLSAHFDHVGVGSPDETGDSIYNGADDDASGTAAVEEIAEAFASLPEAPARSVLFLAVSGEEKGLLGSMAFTRNPTVPIDQVVADVNLDMIGRNAADTVIGIGQEYSSLGGVLQQITATHPDLDLNVVLDPEPEKNFFFRSDQLGFIQQGIPAVFFTTGEHPDYHKPSDELEALDTDKAARVARLGFYLAYAIATNPQKPEWTEEGWKQVQEKLKASPF